MVVMSFFLFQGGLFEKAKQDGMDRVERCRTVAHNEKRSCTRLTKRETDFLWPWSKTKIFG